MTIPYDARWRLRKRKEEPGARSESLRGGLGGTVGSGDADLVCTVLEGLWGVLNAVLRKIKAV